MWFTSKKLFSSILEGKNFLLAEVVLGIACFELLAFEICSCLFAVMQLLPEMSCTLLSYSCFQGCNLKLSIISDGRTNLPKELV